MAELKKTERLDTLLSDALDCCKQYRHEFIVPEHILYALLHEKVFLSVLYLYNGSHELLSALDKILRDIEKVPENAEYVPEPSAQTHELFEMACQKVIFSSAQELDIPHIVTALMSLQQSWAAYLLKEVLDGEESVFISNLITAYEMEDDGMDDFDEQDLDDITREEPWRRLVTCLNDNIDDQHPLIGRERELQRTIQVLCRKEKNNPLHVGEPGVGKTALVYGLTRKIEEGDVPPRLQGCKVFQMELGTMLAGTQYRGDFEKRIKSVMDGVSAQGNVIVYIDEIHNLIGAGRTGEGSMDASNMLKPYLEKGNVRFIGSTTYDEYNRFFSKSKGIVRRFQQIDINEPSIDEAILILKGLRATFEEFHGVVYEDQAIEHAVRQSAKYINERYLPDKAIDLIDEAGAAVEMTMNTEKGIASPAQVVGKQKIDEVLQKVCKIDAAVLKEEDNSNLESLRSRIESQIFGQDEAVAQVVEAIQMSKAGLTEEGKPLASLLFVGPTGVGKTEVAKVLAQELGIQLVRFDMSEYTEKHTVAKLIGSPAGYVGYEDGGLLTDAIRKTPNCVLLLDEIEKAHSDIYNILLQVMDYAVLTDNKGRKSDFRNVVLIMTSNAGAQYAGQAIGFDNNTTRGEAMMKQVKRLFKPEFLNRLSATVTFHDMDMPMASRIMDKKLRQLQAKLDAKHVVLELDEAARALLLKKGFTKEYGAREMDRVIAQMLKTPLMREILFGSLKDGGTAHFVVNEKEEMVICSEE